MFLRQMWEDISCIFYIYMRLYGIDLLKKHE